MASTKVRDGAVPSLAAGSGSDGRAHGNKENPWVWALLVVILVLYVFSALRINPVGTFGTVLDDAVYFSSAKALADGQGYILPSFPIRLNAKKYPELYPLLLSEVWKVDPHFPSNVNLAVSLTLAFGCMALLFAFLLLRRWPQLGDWQALAIVTLCAFTGYFLDLSASIMTDVPFMALILGAFWMAERSGDEKGRRAYWAMGAGLLAGFSVGFRSLGAMAIAGIALAFFVKREYGRLLRFAAISALLTLLFMWPALTAFAHPTGPRLAVGTNGSGWTQTLCYYTSYACNWRLDTSGPGALRAIFQTNLKGVIEQPGMYLMSPWGTRNPLWSLVVVALLSIAAYAGIVRHLRRAGWQSYPITFFFFLPILLFWPYTPDRFLIAFLPLFFGGVWIEGRHFLTLVTKHLRTTHSFASRATAGLLAAGSLLLAALVLVNYAYGIPSKVAMVGRRNEKLLHDELPAYQWIRKHTSPDSKVIAVQDGLAYLYTGRRSITPINCLTQAFYQKDPRYAEHDADHLEDVARHIGASYWLTTRSDFGLYGELDYSILQSRLKKLLAPAHLVYRSADGSVSLYDVRNLTQDKRGNHVDKSIFSDSAN